MTAIGTKCKGRCGQAKGTCTQRNKSSDKYALDVAWLCRIDALEFTIVNVVIDSM